MDDSGVSGDSEMEAVAAVDGCAIGEVCERTGLSSRTVRYYEEIGLVPGVRRRAGGRRIYGSHQVERLRFIQRLKALGLSLAEVKELNAVYALAGSTRTMLQRLDVVLGRRLEELDGRIAELVSLRDEMSKYSDHVASRISAFDHGISAFDQNFDQKAGDEQ